LLQRDIQAGVKAQTGIPMHETDIVNSIREKVFETIDRTRHLIRLSPADGLDWVPASKQAQVAPIDVGHLLGHILECLAGFCAVFHAAFPEKLGDPSKLRELQVNHSCTPAEAIERVNLYAKHIAQGFNCCRDADLARKVPTVFVPEGETLALLLLGNLEHLMNHKYQLFFYLKLLGIPVGTPDLYHLRGAQSVKRATPDYL
jgi:hypothetical protein